MVPLFERFSELLLEELGVFFFASAPSRKIPLCGFMGSIIEDKPSLTLFSHLSTFFLFFPPIPSCFCIFIVVCLSVCLSVACPGSLCFPPFRPTDRFADQLAPSGSGQAKLASRDCYGGNAGNTFTYMHLYQLKPKGGEKGFREKGKKGRGRLGRKKW